MKVITGQIRFSSRLFVVGLALTAFLFIAGCGSDPEPTPTPTPTATPTATPTPAPTATPTLVPALVEQALSMRDFVLDASTTGADLFARLSEQENACIKGVLGDAVYQAMAGFPLMAGGGDSEAAAPLFACFTHENAVLVGVAFLDAAVGGRSAESRACIADFALRHPEFIYARLGLALPEATTFDGEQTRDVLVGFYGCMTESEQSVALAELYASFDVLSPLTGEDLIALLSESEVSCVRGALSEAEYGAMVAATPLRAAGLGVNAAQCLTPDSVVAFLLAATEAQIGALSDASEACANDFIRSHPMYIATIAAHVAGSPSQSSTADFIEAAIGGFDLFACLSEDELENFDQLITAVSG